MRTAIEIDGLTKHFGSVPAVTDLAFTVDAGRVTGFLGPNGAGKSTTLRMLLGLIHPNRGTATFAGRRYGELGHASRHVGAVLEHAGFHPGRTGRAHLRVLAAAGGHDASRVDDVLGQVGLTASADRRVKGYSMGMRQRLGIAAALLGDPEVLILDEPTNGLDPPGIRWVRDLVRAQAERGRAVLISSHLLAEIAQSVDDVVVIAEGRLRASGPLDAVLGGGGAEATYVRTTAPDALRQRLTERSLAVLAEGPDGLVVQDASPERVGAIAAEHGVALVELRPQQRSLEDAFLALTGSPS
ncbi:MAG: ATP-binding cassette domain-containing protein [Ilumatobacteraceae bacterium]